MDPQDIIAALAGVKRYPTDDPIAGMQAPAPLPTTMSPLQWALMQKQQNPDNAWAALPSPHGVPQLTIGRQIPPQPDLGDAATPKVGQTIPAPNMTTAGEAAKPYVASGMQTMLGALAPSEAHAEERPPETSVPGGHLGIPAPGTHPVLDPMAPGLYLLGAAGAAGKMAEPYTGKVDINAAPGYTAPEKGAQNAEGQAASEAKKTAIQNAIGRARTAGSGDQEASPAGYNRTDSPGPGGLGGVVYNPRPEVASIWNKAGISAPPFVELPPEQSGVFQQALAAAKAASPHGAAVTDYGNYATPGMRTFLTPDQKAGFALNNGDIISVFRHPDAEHDNVTVPMLNLAVSQGGNRLDAFDTQLPHLYSRSGFRVVSRTPFNDQYAPEGWDYNRFAHYNGGRPDVVFMAHDPEYAKSYVPGEGTAAPDYDTAQAAQMQAVKGIQKRTDQVRQLADTIPGLSGALKYMTPDEIGRVKKQTAQKMVDIFSGFNPEEMAASAYAGRAKRGWYRESARALQSIFGLQDTPRFAALLAALSPQTSIESNAVNALTTWTNWVRAGRPTDAPSILKILGRSVQGSLGEGSVLDAWKNNAVAALTHPMPENLQLSGPKVDSFAHNLRDHVNHVTNDTWMANYANMDPDVLRGAGVKSPEGKDIRTKGPGYVAMSAAVRRAADILTQKTGELWTPAEVQETIWSWAKTLYEKADSAGEDRNMSKILRAGDLTHEAIGSTPDFAKLFTSNVYRKILEEGGYGPQLESLERNKQPSGTAPLTGSVFGAEGSGFPEFTFQTHLQRAAERLEQVRKRRKGVPDDEEDLHPGF